MVDIPTHTKTAEPAASASLEACEHVLLVKHLARLQKQMSQLVHGYEAQLRHWQRQLMRQSVRLMLERTRADWGLVGTPTGARPPADPQVLGTLAFAATDALICRTGCQMDGDHWRDGELCKRDGRACAMGVSAASETEI